MTANQSEPLTTDEHEEEDTSQPCDDTMLTAVKLCVLAFLVATFTAVLLFCAARAGNLNSRAGTLQACTTSQNAIGCPVFTSQAQISSLQSQSGLFAFLAWLSAGLDVTSLLMAGAIVIYD